MDDLSVLDLELLNLTKQVLSFGFQVYVAYALIFLTDIVWCGFWDCIFIDICYTNTNMIQI